MKRVLLLLLVVLGQLSFGALPREFVMVVYSPQSGEYSYWGQEELARQRFSPCSTFKIVSTLMGLESGVVESLDSRLGYDGTLYEFDFWNGDLTLKEAFQLSCVPYYKKLTSRLSKSFVQSCLADLQYGNQDISVWDREGHNGFWLMSSLQISPLEQIGVLERILASDRFSCNHVALLKDCMLSGSGGDYALFGKSGAGRSQASGKLEAWYVGFGINAQNSVIYFAVHGADDDRDVSSPELREVARGIIADIE